MQVLTAATHPLDGVEAERLARDNAGSQPEAVQASLANRGWDQRVKALVGYSDVLSMMSENLDWTRDLGEAFLRDQAGLLDAVQRMRQRARDAGTLTTTPEQVVGVRQDQIIVVEPASPSVVYVPACRRRQTGRCQGRCRLSCSGSGRRRSCRRATAVAGGAGRRLPSPSWRTDAGRT